MSQTLSRIYVDFQAFHFKTRKDRSLFIVCIGLFAISYMLFGLVSDSIGLSIWAFAVGLIAIFQILELFRTNRDLTHFFGKTYFRIDEQFIAFKPGVFSKAVFILREEIEDIEIRLYRATIKAKGQIYNLDFNVVRDKDLKAIKESLRNL